MIDTGLRNCLLSFYRRASRVVCDEPAQFRQICGGLGLFDPVRKYACRNLHIDFAAGPKPVAE